MKLFTLLFLPLALVAGQDPLQQLVKLAKQGNGVITLDPQTFDLLTNPKRTWSTSIQLTALDKRRKCTPCKQFDPSFNAVAKAWSGVPAQHRNNHFFATLDFDNGQTVFQKLGLQSAPVVYVYPAAEGPRAPASGKVGPLKYDFSNGFDAAPLAESLSKQTPIPIPYREPIDWSRYFVIGLGVAAVLVTLRFSAPILQNRWTWALVTITVSLVMTSGYMFTRIRSSPYNGGGGNWVASGYQNQFGQEVTVVSCIYGLLATSFLMLILVVPRQTSPSRQRVQVYLWTGVFMIMYSMLVSLFRIKNRGYPFKLFLG
ncbi:Dolichyl-diphosphooligosaccharide--protein glycosyltransferase subunit 3 [Hypsizygus marmoreus]|uniref:Dolichyl-diphosphooligosaccharide--protein glycosyltransferase subunit 3 n=1 Tax=Hypsizygus marmoreus TaxID=39966 RepID=A0A369JIB4_HYPMA|nr:Dolichyl-diphosphooligosaccharide--protein glycosyltransferase subunit 3 [Hypsizygus marmoreus]